MIQGHPTPIHQVIKPQVRWEQLALPTETLVLLRQVVDQCRRRSQIEETRTSAPRLPLSAGGTILFAGGSDLVRAAAAEVLAGSLGQDLHRLDMSAVVSKYIGETEKNLHRVFADAEAGGAALFFDEADALFGRRTEVKDSHDRYANLEVAHLLERMESHGELVILATNRKEDLDPAFLRRLRFVVDFPHPG